MEISTTTVIGNNHIAQCKYQFNVWVYIEVYF